MNTIERARFVKLVEFLENLDPKKFLFSDVVADVDNEHHCGSVCCAIGWTPVVFPDLVEWVSDGWGIRHEEGGWRDFHNIASELFGIDDGVAEALFSPYNQQSVHESLDICQGSSSPQQVAAMLRQFLALVDSGEINPDFDPISEDQAEDE